MLAKLCSALVVLPVAVAPEQCTPNVEPVDAARTFSHAEELADTFGARPPGSLASAQASEYIHNVFEDYGLADVHYQPFDAHGVEGRNVVATMSGSVHPESIIVIGAHYDSISGGIGAADNATGVASLLEIAKYFSENSPAYTLRFVAFDAEEVGLVGSEVYYNSLSVNERANTVLMLCLDMTQSNASHPLRPLVFFVLSQNSALHASFKAVKRDTGPFSDAILRVPPDLAAAFTGGRLRTDAHHWHSGGVTPLAWPWAFGVDGVDYHATPGSMEEIDETGLAITTHFTLEFLRALQSYGPQELLASAEAPLPVDEEAMNLLAEKGGVKP